MTDDRELIRLALDVASRRAISITEGEDSIEGRKAFDRLIEAHYALLIELNVRRAEAEVERAHREVAQAQRAIRERTLAAQRAGNAELRKITQAAQEQTRLQRAQNLLLRPAKRPPEPPAKPLWRHVIDFFRVHLFGLGPSADV